MAANLTLHAIKGGRFGIRRSELSQWVGIARNSGFAEVSDLGKSAKNTCRMIDPVRRRH
jgi:hypothetical protein